MHLVIKEKVVLEEEVVKISLKIIILLFFFTISGCDYRCIPPESNGSTSTISVQLYANPYYGGNLRQNIYARCKPGCTNCKENEIDGVELWLNLATEYNPDFNYDIGVSGEVAFCEVSGENLVGPELQNKLIANLYTSKINLEKSLAGQGMIEYKENEEIILWRDISGKENHASRTGAAPNNPSCQDKIVYESRLQYKTEQLTKFYDSLASTRAQIFDQLRTQDCEYDDKTDGIVKLKKGDYRDLTDIDNKCELSDMLFQFSKSHALQYEYKQNHPFNGEWNKDSELDEISFNREIIKVPYGCKVTVFLDKDFGYINGETIIERGEFDASQILTYKAGSNGMITDRYFEYDIGAQKIFKNSCTENPTGWVDTNWGYSKLKHNENSVLEINNANAAASVDINAYNIGQINHPTARMNDRQDFIRVPPGCRVNVWGGNDGEGGEDLRQLILYHTSTHINEDLKKRYKDHIKENGYQRASEYIDPENSSSPFIPNYYMNYYETDEADDDIQYFPEDYDGHKGYAGFYLNGTNLKERVRWSTKVGVDNTGADYRWQTRILSLKIEDDPNPPPGFNSSTSIPKIKLKSISNKPAIYFDGGVSADDEPDYYDFNKFGLLLKKHEFTIIFIMQGKNGTILSANHDNSNFDLIGRLFVNGNKLKFYYDNSNDNIRNGSTYELSNTLATDTTYVVTIQKKIEIIDGEVKYKINSRINSEDLNKNHEISAPVSDYKQAIIGGYFDLENSAPKIFDPYQGHIGQMIFFSASLSDIQVNDLEKNLLKDLGLGSCPFDPFLQQLRLRIGDFSTNESIFNDAGEFELPESYKGQPAGGTMMIRYEEPLSLTSPNIKECPLHDDLYLVSNDNQKFISISMKIDKGTHFVSDLYRFFVQPIERYIKGGTTSEGRSFIGVQKRFFDKISNPNTSIIPTLIKFSLIFYIIFTAMGYLLGLSKYSNWDLISRISKTAIIIALTSNWNIFNTYLVMFFRDGAIDLGNNIVGVSQQLGVVSSLDSNSKIANIFKGLDEIISLFTSSDVNAKIWSLLFYPPMMGAIIVLLFYISFYIFIEVIARILIVYISVFIMITFAFIIAPIFLIFSLFKQTQSLFTKWLDLVIGYALQYIMLATAIGFFGSVIKALFINLLGFTVCWQPILYCCGNTPFTIPILEWYKPIIFDYSRFSLDIKSQYIPNIWDVALLLVVIYFFKKYLNFVIDLAARISGGISVSNLTESINKTLGTSDMIGSAKSTLKTVDSALNNAGKAISLASKVAAKISPISSEQMGKLAGKATGKMFGDQAGSQAEKFIGTKLKGGIRNPYKKAKKALSSNSIGRVNRAVFGTKKGEEKMLINNIKDAIESGIEQSVITGENKEDAVKDTVRNMLQNKGVKEEDIKKILESSQLNKDIKNHKLQTNEARRILKKQMKDTYKATFDSEYKRLQKSKPKKQAKIEANKIAQAKAIEAADKVKENIGSMLEQEELIESKSTINKNINKIFRNSVERRLKNMAIMADRVDKEFKDKPEEKESDDFLHKKIKALDYELKKVHGAVEEELKKRPGTKLNPEEEGQKQKMIKKDFDIFDNSFNNTNRSVNNHSELERARDNQNANRDPNSNPRDTDGNSRQGATDRARRRNIVDPDET